MKTLKKVLIGVIAAPFVLILLLIAYEIFGMIVNHAATGIQTDRMRRNIQELFPQTKIISADAQTGNSSGTGNHVDCVSMVTFTSALPLFAVSETLSERYELDEWCCYVSETDTAGEYCFFLLRSAPFPDNIEGH